MSNYEMQTLNKVYQSTLDVDEGDCFGACLASITGISPKTVPLFRGRDWFNDCFWWLLDKGIIITQHSGHQIGEGYYLVARDPCHIKDVGWRCHLVVYKDGVQVHDPLSNRSRQEIVAANNAQGINESNVLSRQRGIVYTMMVRSLPNVTT